MSEPFFDAVSSFVAELAKAYRAAHFYPVNHPTLGRSVERAHMRMRAMFFRDAEIQLVISKQQILLDEKPVQVSASMMQELAFAIFRRRVKFLHISRESTDVELHQFLAFLVDDPRAIHQKGGPEKALARRGVMNIWCNETRFLRSEIEEEIFEEDEELPEEQEEELEQENLLQDLAEDPHLQKLAEQLLAEERHEVFARLLQQVMRDAKKAAETGGPPAMFPVLLVLYQVTGRDDERMRNWAIQGMRALVDEVVIEHLVRHMFTTVGSSWEKYRDIVVLLGNVAVPYVLVVLNDEQSRKGRLRGLELIKCFGPDAELYLMQQIHDPRWFVVRNALHVLYEMADETMVPAVAPLLEHEHEMVRREAARLIRVVGTEESFTVLRKGLRRAKGVDKRVYISELASFPTAWSEPVILPYLHKGPLAVRIEAAQSLAIIGSPAALQALAQVFIKSRKVLGSEQHGLLRKAVGEQLLGLLPDSMPVFDRVRQDSAPAIRKLVEKADAIMLRKKAAALA